MKKGICTFLCTLLFVLCFPVFVFADAQTYYTPSEPLWIGTNRTYKYYVRVEGDCRIVALGTSASSRNGNTWAVRKRGSSASYYYGEDANNPSNTGTFPASYTAGDGQIYEMASFQTEIGWGVTIPDGINLNIVESNSQRWAYEYTFGDHAEAPVEPVNWGILRDVRYDTSIAGNGLASSNNIDYIRWNKFIDTNSNDISSMHVEIQAVPGYWRGSDYQDYISKNFSDFDNGSLSPVSLGNISVSLGGFSISWNAVFSKFGFSNYDIFASLKGAVWESVGWFYQVRLVTDDGYVGEWQTIYTTLGSSAAGSQQTVNSYEYNSNLYQYLENISILNNQETINLTVNETTTIIQNPQAVPTPSPTPEEGDPDYTSIIQAIRLGVVNILKGISELPDKVLSLFVYDSVPSSADESLETANNNLDDAIPVIPQLKNFSDDVKDIVININEAEPVLIWQSVQMQGVDLIQGGTVDLRQFLQEQQMQDLYNIYLVVINGVCYGLTIIFVWRKVQEVLSE